MMNAMTAFEQEALRLAALSRPERAPAIAKAITEATKALREENERLKAEFREEKLNVLVAAEIAQERLAALDRVRNHWPHIEVPAGKHFTDKRTVDPGAPTCLRCKIEELTKIEEVTDADVR